MVMICFHAQVLGWSVNSYSLNECIWERYVRLRVAFGEVLESGMYVYIL